MFVATVTRAEERSAKVRSTRITQARWIAARPRVGAAGKTSVPSVGYHAGEDRWWLWWPCRDCGGVQLPLLFRPTLRGGAYDVQALVARLERRRCPVCETRRRRARPRGHDTAVWYDTQLGDWVLRLPTGADSEALLPLEIGWFDASEALVYRTASDLASSGDALGP
jgi:hypothetical protein